MTPLIFEQVQEYLDDETTLLSYFVAPEVTLAFVLTQDSFEIVELLVNAKELHETVEQTRLNPEKIEVWIAQQHLQQLYDWLIRPLTPHLKTSVIGIIPHGILHQLPFSALLDRQSRQYFGDEHVLFELASVSLIQFTKQQAQIALTVSEAAKGRVVAMEYSPSIGKGYLPGAKKEVETLETEYAPDVLTVYDATETDLREVMHDTVSRILHLSGHGKLKLNMPMFSGIIFGADNQHDGVVEVHDVYSFDLTGTGLVFLSACESGLGKRSSGDDIIGLKRAFIYAGASSVIGTLWNVDDMITYQFTKSFYSALQDRMSKAEALRRARIETRMDHPHPYDWAGFVLTGDPGRISNSYFPGSPVSTNAAQ